jgi:hypothetical protein
MKRSRSIRIGKRLQRKLENLDDELAARGIEVVYVGPRRAKKKAAHFAQSLSYLQTIWLIYQVTVEAIRRWPQIRKWLLPVGITRNEIITLRLAEMMRSPQKKRTKKVKRSQK